MLSRPTQPALLHVRGKLTLATSNTDQQRILMLRCWHAAEGTAAGARGYSATAERLARQPPAGSPRTLHHGRWVERLSLLLLFVGPYADDDGSGGFCSTYGCR